MLCERSRSVRRSSKRNQERNLSYLCGLWDAHRVRGRSGDVARTVLKQGKEKTLKCR